MNTPSNAPPAPTLTAEISHIIRLAWEDRTSFDEIYRQIGLREAEVILVMRTHLGRSSFKMWRKRVSGRKTKHRQRLQKFLELPSEGTGERFGELAD